MKDMLFHCILFHGINRPAKSGINCVNDPITMATVECISLAHYLKLRALL
jgi:hypothetical protein